MITRQLVGQFYPVKPLGEIVEFLDSRRRPVTESERKSGPFPYYGANGVQGHIDSYLFDEPLLLLAEDGGHFDEPSRGIAYRISGKSWVNNHAHVIRPKRGIDLGFLCRVLENYDVGPFISGTTRSKLTKGQAEKIGIPVPPLGEQRRIAAVLDQVDELRRKRRLALERINGLARAIFIETFGDPIVNPKRLPTFQLKELGRVSTGSTPPGGRDGMFGGNIPFVTPGDLGSTEPVRRTVTEEGAAAARTVRAGATLVCCIGATIGKMDKARDRSAFNQQINAVEWLENVDDDYAFHTLMFFKERVASWGASTTLPILKKSSFEVIDIPVPPLRDQKSFAARIFTVEKLKPLQRTHLAYLDDLFGSLQDRAFNGGL